MLRLDDRVKDDITLCSRKSYGLMFYGMEKRENGEKKESKRVVCKLCKSESESSPRPPPSPKRVYVMVGGLKVGACVWDERLTAS